MRAVAVLLLSMVLALSGCSRAPDIDQVEKDIADQLAAAFGAGVFS